MLSRAIGVIALLAALAYPCSFSYTKRTYHKHLRSNTSLFRFEDNNKAGFIDEKGKIVIPPQFDIGWFAEEDFVEGLSPARVGEKWGFIDPAGRWAVLPDYWRVQPFSEGLAAVTFPLKNLHFRHGFIDKTGRLLFELPEGVSTVGPFSEGLVAVRQSGKVSVGRLGYVDRTGKTVIPYQFAQGGPFREGLAAVAFDGQCYVEAREQTPRFTSPSVPPATSCGGVPSFITQRCGEGFIDRKGELVFRFDGVRDFSEGLAAVEQRGRWGFINSVGKFRIEPQFGAVLSFSGGLAAARQEGHWGYIDTYGNWVIPPQFKEAASFSDGLALTDSGYIDRTGTVVANATEPTAFVQGLAHVRLTDTEMGYIDHRGKVVFRYRPEPAQPSRMPY